MEFFIIIGLILLNGVLAMSEIAMVSARKSRLETEARTGNKSARRALKLANEPDRFLSTVQIGITLIGILTGLYSGQALAGDLAVWVEKIEALQPHALLISKTIIVIVVTYLTLIFGELVPKRIGMVAAERMAKIIAAPMDILSRIASPFVWLLSASTSFMMRVLGLNKTGSNKITEEEIKAIIQDENIVMPLSVMPHGEYGLSDLYLGIPAVLNGSGIRELVEYHLTNQEHQALLASAAVLQEANQKVQQLVKW